MTKCKIGLGYRAPFKKELLQSDRPTSIQALEFTAEHFFHGRELSTLKKLSLRYESILHCLGLNIGSPDELCTWRLNEIRSISEICKAKYISDHFAFTRYQDIDLGHLNPIPFDASTLDRFCDRAKWLCDFFGKPMIFENITRFSTLESTYSETNFMNEFCRRSQCGILLDLTNLYVNSKNLNFDPQEWLSEIDLNFVKQLHIVGYSESCKDGLLMDAHAESTQPEILDLKNWVLQRCRPEFIILERDENISELKDLKVEINQICSEPAEAAL